MSNDDNAWSWDEGEDDKIPLHSELATDLSFKLNCRCVPVDHAQALHDAVTTALPWFKDEPLAGLHLIHLAGSQNGWMRPEEPDELLYLSKRTRLMIRIPRSRLSDAQQLNGQTLRIHDNEMTIGAATEKPLTPNDILFSRYVLAQDNDDENSFLRQAASDLKQMNIRFRKLLPGKQLKLRTRDGEVCTRTLMVADLDLKDSIRLQELGLGEGRHQGFGLFIHHKGIKSARPDEMDD